jgi:hypothetical protein
MGVLVDIRGTTPPITDTADGAAGALTVSMAQVVAAVSMEGMRLPMVARRIAMGYTDI